MTTAIRIIPDSVTDAYEAVRKLIYQTIRKFQLRHGGDWQEIESEANMIFVERIWPKWDPERSSLVTWTDRNLWINLLRWRNKEWRRTNRTEALNGDGDDASFDPTAKREFDPDRFLREASDSVREAVRIALDNPKDITKFHSHKSWVMRLLRELGWTGEEIVRTFGEVREALMA
jgi:hypothetical protein